jgi:hypothetical protein
MKEEGQDRRSAKDAAAVLPFVLAFLLLPPIILIFAKPVLIAGVPLIVIYIFGVWAAAICAAMVLARRLAGEERAAAKKNSAQSGPL